MILEPLINTHKIKYSVLNNLSKEIEGLKECKNLNIYINLESLFKSFYGGNVASDVLSLSSEESVTLCSEIANLSAHYRRYFWTRHNKNTTIYYYYMNKKPKKNIDMYDDYAKSILKKKSSAEFAGVNKVIKDNLRLFTMLSFYLPKVYFALSDGLEPALIPYHFIKKSEDTDANLIISRDPYEYQLLENDNTSILRLKYDDSYIINKDNLVDILLEKLKYKPKNKIDGRYYAKVFPLVSCKSRSVSAMKGYGNVALLKMIDSKYDDLSPDMSYRLLLSTIGVDLEEDVFDRYQFMYLTLQYKRLSKVDKIKIEEFIIDKYENRTIMNINSEYFPSNPINLIDICRGVNIYEE